MSNINKYIRISDILYRHLKGETSDDEKEILECWTKKQENADFLSQVQNTDLLYDKMYKMYNTNTEDAFQKLCKKKNSLRRKKRIRIAWSIAASLILIIGLNIFLEKESESIPTNVYVAEVFPEHTTLTTALGETMYLPDTVHHLSSVISTMSESRSNTVVADTIAINRLRTSRHGIIKITLSDSSQVWLNGGSELKYPDIFAKNERVVELKGEAYFDVKKDSIHPFIIQTPSSDIEVLGTRFNLYSRDSAHCITTLVSGSVKMRTQQNIKTIIYPGQEAELMCDGTIKISAVNTSYASKWMNDYFAFYDKDLGYIANNLANWYGCNIEFTDTALTKLTYTTIIKHYNDIEHVLDILCHTEDFSYKMLPNGSILITKN